MKRLLVGLLLLAGAALVLTGMDGWARLATDGQHWLTDMRQRYPGAGDALLFMAGVILVAILFLRLMWLGQNRRDRADTYVRVYGRPAPRQPGRLSLAYAAVVSLADRARSQRARPAVRPLTAAELEASAADLDAWQREMYADALPEQVTAGQAVVGVAWPERVTPLEMDYEPSYVGPPTRIPGYVPLPAVWDPDTSYDPSYAGRAAEWLSDLRTGAPVYDEGGHAADVHGSLYADGREVPRTLYAALAEAYRERQDVIDAPVSPAAPPNYRPRHDADNPPVPAHAIGYNRVAARVLNQATGGFPIVRPVVRQLVGAS